jgi:hypothetical protein
MGPRNLGRKIEECDRSRPATEFKLPRDRMEAITKEMRWLSIMSLLANCSEPGEVENGRDFQQSVSPTASTANPWIGAAYSGIRKSCCRFDHSNTEQVGAFSRQRLHHIPSLLLILSVSLQPYCILHHVAYATVSGWMVPYGVS